MRLILNGKSAENLAVREAVSSLRESGHSLEIKVTWEAGDAERFADEARREGVDTVIAGGGDGTVHEVVRGLFRAGAFPKTALGILPLGTANDFATSCQIPLDPLAALSLIVEGNSVLIDVAKANEHLFINVAVGGFGAEVTANTPPALKRILGGTAYSVMGLVTAMKMQPYQGKIVSTNGTLEGGVILLAIGNGRQSGGGYQITPAAHLNDGLLDVMFVPEFPSSELGSVINELLNPHQSENRYVYYQQLPDFELQLSIEAPMNFDGEPKQVTSLRFEVLKQQLPIFLPPNISMLL